MRPLLHTIANLDGLAKNAIRIGLSVVFIWIGALKFFDYEAEGITPFVANSPLMSFFYDNPGQYASHIDKEGAFNPDNHAWHEANNTYGFSYGLGVFLIVVGVLVLFPKVAPLWSTAGSALIFSMTLGTLSFLVTTPETWVPDLDGANSGFPFLSARGRLVVKDVVILGAALVTMSESAKIYLKRNPIHSI